MRINSPYEYEPLRKNRFELLFGEDEFIDRWIVKVVGAPTININPVEYNYMNTAEHVAGRFKWGQMSITLRDHIGPSGSQKLMEWVRLHAESITGRMGYAFGYKKDLVLNTVDPLGVTVQSWRLVQCMIVGDVNFGERTYDDDSLQELTFNVQPRYCQLLF